MFKIDKKTHLIILFTFAMVFVVVYLYYTIQDLRKTQIELKRVQDELAVVKNLTSTVSTMKTDVDELKTVKHIKANIDITKINGASAPIVNVAETPIVVAQQEQVTAARGNPSVTNIEDTDVPSGDIDVEDTASSVDTAEIRNMLDGGMDDEEGAVEEVPGDVEEVVASSDSEHEEEAEPPKKQFTPEQLKNMKVEELKDLCRDYNLSTKGNKSDLLVRIFDHLGMN